MVRRPKQKKIPLGLEHRAVEITGDESAHIPAERTSRYQPVRAFARTSPPDEDDNSICLDCDTPLVPCTCRPDCPGGMCPTCP